MIVQLMAVDRNGNLSFKDSVTVHSKEELLEEFSIFDDIVPFKRWYHDHFLEDATQEENDIFEECLKEFYG